MHWQEQWSKAVPPLLSCASSCRREKTRVPPLLSCASSCRREKTRVPPLLSCASSCRRDKTRLPPLLSCASSCRRDKTRVQRHRNENSNKICVLEGVGEGGELRENCPKPLFSLGNVMTIKCGNSSNFIVRDFVVTSEALRSATIIVGVLPSLPLMQRCRNKTAS